MVYWNIRRCPVGGELLRPTYDSVFQSMGLAAAPGYIEHRLLTFLRLVSRRQLGHLL